jgi:DNA invertase Pin-like site-specific DNA recombinase
MRRANGSARPILRTCRFSARAREQPRAVRAEKRKGADRNERSDLQILSEFPRPGDTPVVTGIDRPARSMNDLQAFIHELDGRRVTLRATDKPINTGFADGQSARCPSVALAV